MRWKAICRRKGEYSKANSFCDLNFSSLLSNRNADYLQNDFMESFVQALPVSWDKVLKIKLPCMIENLCGGCYQGFKNIRSFSFNINHQTVWHQP